MNNSEIKNEIRSFIPRQLLSHVQEIDIDSDGIWVWFDDCVEHDTLGCHTAHAEGIDELRDELGRFRLAKRICAICGKGITKGQRAVGLLNFARPDAKIPEAHAECYFRKPAK